MYANKIINNILGNPIKKDGKSKNKKIDLEANAQNATQKYLNGEITKSQLIRYINVELGGDYDETVDYVNSL